MTVLVKKAGGGALLAWTALELEAGWKALAEHAPELQLAQDGVTMRLRGRVEATAEHADGATIAKVPEAASPTAAAFLFAIAYTANGVALEINAGKVTLRRATLGKGVVIGLDGLTYPLE